MQIETLIKQLEQAKEEGVKSVLIGTEQEDIVDGGYFTLLQDVVSRTIVGDLVIFNTVEHSDE